ncbi:hypothetical protein Pst134EA_031614 [Puccinia striiformis f. sp. tritici]|uniref:uncharacterized protein n=1 Tax=Puccinia striiformis f. sp. tritici TaxID=168172 RepID=UPI00200737D9|nr:uncharacterized protein Pst134EA_031614 [Puccinia striiformis f. sp. tritici]KAH9445215.1 hypothetical protein Pst134EA_031614 [Puccinia striiformis f. sp. tritici]KAH9447719.1 hypothetical protein Pst134EB_021721 [Puccinia striiformis f. sp. tritici]
MLLKSILFIEIIQLALPTFGSPLGRTVQSSSAGSIASAHRAQPNHFIKRGEIQEVEAFKAASTPHAGEGIVNEKPTAYKPTLDVTPSSGRATSPNTKSIPSTSTQHALSGKLEDPSPEVMNDMIGSGQGFRSNTKTLQDHWLSQIGASYRAHLIRKGFGNDRLWIDRSAGPKTAGKTLERATPVPKNFRIDESAKPKIMEKKLERATPVPRSFQIDENAKPKIMQKKLERAEPVDPEFWIDAVAEAELAQMNFDEIAGRTFERAEPLDPST